MRDNFAAEAASQDPHVLAASIINRAANIGEALLPRQCQEALMNTRKALRKLNSIPHPPQNKWQESLMRLHDRTIRRSYVMFMRYVSD